MKARSILIILGSIMILLNGLSYISGKMDVPETSIENKIAYLIGRNMFFIPGLILLVISFFLHRKVIRKRKMKMMDSFIQ